MRKLRSRSGMTLVEVMVSLLILTLLVTVMGTGMETAVRVCSDSLFESHSASLAGIVNTALGDVLRYAQDIRTSDSGFTDASGARISRAGFVFTNLEYGVQDVYFFTPVAEDGSCTGILQLKSLHYVRDTDEIAVTDLVNSGAYPNLAITNFEAVYVAPGTIAEITLNDGTVVETSRGGYFYITYTIVSTIDNTKTREVETIARLLNAE